MVIQRINHVLESFDLAVKLQDLSGLNLADRLLELDNLLGDPNLQLEVTRFGGRVLKEQDSKESIPIRVITIKFVNTFDAFLQKTRPEPVSQRITFQDRAREIVSHLVGIYDVIDEKIAQSNIFVRILAVIRKYILIFSGSEYSEFHAYVCLHGLWNEAGGRDGHFYCRV